MSTETKAVHTAGPWEISQQQGLRLFVVANGEAIAELFTGEKFNGELFANGLLIAAAPDMLEALKLAKNVLFLLHDEVKALGHKAEQVPEKIRAAINKATGEDGQ